MAPFAQPHTLDAQFFHRELSIEPPENMQPQSALMSLPNELKDMIFGYSLILDVEVNDAAMESSTTWHPVQNSGLKLVGTCRLAYYESDRRLFFSVNTFAFTNIQRLGCFLEAIGPENAAALRHLEISIRDVYRRGDHGGITEEWLGYLRNASSPYGQILTSLNTLCPNLRTLSLDFVAWGLLPLFRKELWTLIERMLVQVQNLERVTVTGASLDYGTFVEPWSPTHFVGAVEPPDTEGDLILAMWRAVARSHEPTRMIRWQRERGRVTLEVGPQPDCDASSAVDILEYATTGWPEIGYCSLEQYWRYCAHVTTGRRLDITSAV
ncbi:hypothetical protein M011DRAFT_413834 [Sporormia fimetaria CBS 119925]|uniref:Uncharacterized protein n=1 Tax=Sporormia fimetaria CBS 119925 TaxID=1340428 RepID=A0A6A6UVG8_9PLEO|nr:hypothetical protein M011DRAFT_413834 [Sporormia fimetaria CBS 119925]